MLFEFAGYSLRSTLTLKGKGKVVSTLYVNDGTIHRRHRNQKTQLFPGHVMAPIRCATGHIDFQTRVHLEGLKGVWSSRSRTGMV